MARPALSLKDRKPTTYVACVLLALLEERKKTLPEFAAESGIDDATVYRLIYGRRMTDEVFATAWEYFNREAEKYALTRAHLRDELARMGVNPLSHEISAVSPFVDSKTERKVAEILAHALLGQMPWPKFKAR
jgi:hypothetical protein